MPNTELYDFETKIMTPSSQIEKEARQLLMDSDTLQGEIMNKYGVVLRPLLEKKTKSELYKAFLKLVRALHLPNPDEEWTVLDHKLYTDFKKKNNIT
jgi:hypothetical protein